MSDKTSPKIDLFSYALEIQGGEPVEIAVGDGLDLKVRTSHTGKQFAEWMKIEQDRADRSARILADKETNAVEKNQKLNASQRDYLGKLINSIVVDGTDEKDTREAVKRIAALPADARSSVIRSLGELAGLVDAQGNPTRSTARSSKTKDNSDS